jgi:endogenous inhibitor of DNA gyrase (YacG/DUF329 family)
VSPGAGLRRSWRSSMPRNPDMPCADCGQMMWRSRTSLPEGQAKCRPCRRTAALASARPDCVGCGTSLTERQRLNQGHYCSTRCAYIAFKGWDNPGPKVRDRDRMSGGARPVDVPCCENDYPIEPCEYPPRAPWLEGPLRSHPVLRRVYEDGRVEIRCSWCYIDTLTLSADAGWCRRCAVLWTIDPPRPKVVREKRVQLPKVKTCVACDSSYTGRRVRYCSDDCLHEWNARQNRERYRERVGLPSTWDRPVKKHAA